MAAACVRTGHCPPRRAPSGRRGGPSPRRAASSGAAEAAAVAVMARWEVAAALSNFADIFLHLGPRLSAAAAVAASRVGVAMGGAA